MGSAQPPPWNLQSTVSWTDEAMLVLEVLEALEPRAIRGPSRKAPSFPSTSLLPHQLPVKFLKAPRKPLPTEITTLPSHL